MHSASRARTARDDSSSERAGASEVEGVRQRGGKGRRAWNWRSPNETFEPGLSGAWPFFSSAWASTVMVAVLPWSFRMRMAGGVSEPSLLSNATLTPDFSHITDCGGRGGQTGVVDAVHADRPGAPDHSRRAPKGAHARAWTGLAGPRSAALRGSSARKSRCPSPPPRSWRPSSWSRSGRSGQSSPCSRPVGAPASTCGRCGVSARGRDRGYGTGAGSALGEGNHLGGGARGAGCGHAAVRQLLAADCGLHRERHGCGVTVVCATRVEGGC